MHPKCFGRYILVTRIAAGGMGEVFTAVPLNLWGYDKFFALKRILPSLGHNEEFAQRFRDEVRLVLPMNHPNVVQVIEVGRVGDEFFIVMELVEGRDLRQMMSRFTRWRQQMDLPIPAALYIARELLAGLDYCHQHRDALGRELGVVHRDVCPSNVLVSYEGAIKLADFGLALSGFKAVKTDPRHLLGHAGYIAPETIMGDSKVDHRADIYGAGVILFELLTGQRFISSKDLSAIYRLKQLRAEVRPSELRPEIPPEVDELVTNAVAFDPADRYGTALEFHDDVQRVLALINPIYGGRTFAETVMRRYFRPGERRQRLRALVQEVDLEQLLSLQSPARPAEPALPLEASGTTTLAPEPLDPPADSPYQGDTEPMPLRALMELELSSDASAPTPVQSRPLSGSWPRINRPRWRTPRTSRTSSFPRRALDRDRSGFASEGSSRP